MYEVLEKALDNAMHIGEIPKGNAKFGLTLSYLYYLLGILKMKITILFLQI